MTWFQIKFEMFQDLLQIYYQNYIWELSLVKNDSSLFL